MVDFIDDIRAFAIDIPEKSEKLLTEEGTKNALVMPFIRILGYNVFNPNEVNLKPIRTKTGGRIQCRTVPEPPTG